METQSILLKCFLIFEVFQTVYMLDVVLVILWSILLNYLPLQFHYVNKLMGGQRWIWCISLSRLNTVESIVMVMWYLFVIHSKCLVFTSIHMLNLCQNGRQSSVSLSIIHKGNVCEIIHMHICHSYWSRWILEVMKSKACHRLTITTLIVNDYYPKSKFVWDQEGKCCEL